MKDKTNIRRKQIMEQNTNLFEEEVTTTTLGDDEMTTNTHEVYEETTGGTEQNFWDRNKTTVLTATGTATAGFVSGFFVGKYTEKKKRELFMQEVRKQVALFSAQAQGIEEVEWEGVKVPTATHKFDNADDVKAVIVQDYLKDKKVSDKEKAEWRALLVELISLGELARAQQILKEKEIIREEKKDAE